MHIFHICVSDAMTVIGFLKHFHLENDFKVMNNVHSFITMFYSHIHCIIHDIHWILNTNLIFSITKRWTQNDILDTPWFQHLYMCVYCIIPFIQLSVSAEYRAQPHHSCWTFLWAWYCHGFCVSENFIGSWSVSLKLAMECL